jgi:large-conductance mechanosensitive channel
VTLLTDFKKFLLRGNVVDLAVAVDGQGLALAAVGHIGSIARA